MTAEVVRPFVEELRLTAFKSFRRAVVPLAPLTVLHGPAGAGKSNVLDALTVLSRLALGEDITTALDGEGRGAPPVRGGTAGCAPHGRDSFVLGCTVRSPAGPVQLDVAVHAGDPPRITRERLMCAGELLLETGPEDRGRGTVNVTWRNDGRQGDIRGPFPSGALITAQVPLRVAGATPAERRVLTAAEQALTALREVFPLDPVPQLMRRWVPADPGARLRRSASNISAVVARMQTECRIRHGRLARLMRSASPHPLRGLEVVRDAAGRVMLALDEGEPGRTTIDRAGDGMLRFLAFAAVLLTGAGVLEMTEPSEIPWERRLLTVLGEDLGAGLAREQTAALLALARETASKGHIRLLASVQDPQPAAGGDALLVECVRDPATGRSLARPGGEGQAVTREEPVRAAAGGTAGITGPR